MKLLLLPGMLAGLCCSVLHDSIVAIPAPAHNSVSGDRLRSWSICRASGSWWSFFSYPACCIAGK